MQCIRLGVMKRCDEETMRLNRSLLPAAAAVAAWSGAGMAWAQQDSGSADQPTQVQEIVVTANYRAQAIQDVVGSAQAFGGKDLDRSGAAGMQDYLLQVPSVSYQPSGNGTDKIGM